MNNLINKFELTLDMKQLETLNACINDRIDNIEENIEMCDADDPTDVENITAYRDELNTLEEIMKQLNPRQS